MTSVIQRPTRPEAEPTRREKGSGEIARDRRPKRREMRATQRDAMWMACGASLTVFLAKNQ